MKKIYAGLAALLLSYSVSYAAEEVKKINLNQATVEQLLHVVKGIGQKRAEAIVEFRKTHGPYASVDDLAQVHGFGKAFITRQSEALRAAFFVE